VGRRCTSRRPAHPSSETTDRADASSSSSRRMRWADDDAVGFESDGG
jgi:hypothetical protein